VSPTQCRVCLNYAWFVAVFRLLNDTVIRKYGKIICPFLFLKPFWMWTAKWDNYNIDLVSFVCESTCDVQRNEIIVTAMHLSIHSLCYLSKNFSISGNVIHVTEITLYWREEKSISIRCENSGLLSAKVKSYNSVIELMCNLRPLPVDDVRCR